jgi:hypothetical protein
MKCVIHVFCLVHDLVYEDFHARCANIHMCLNGIEHIYIYGHN